MIKYRENDRAFDLMNESGEGSDLFEQKVNLTAQVINNLPKNADMVALLNVVDNMIDDERWVLGFKSQHAGVDVNPQELLANSMRAVVSSEDLSKQHPLLTSIIHDRMMVLEGDMSITVGDDRREKGLNMNFEKQSPLMDYQYGASGGMNPLAFEEVSFDPESFDYIDAIAQKEIHGFASKRLDNDYWDNEYPSGPGERFFDYK